MNACNGAGAQWQASQSSLMNGGEARRLAELMDQAALDRVGLERLRRLSSAGTMEDVQVRQIVDVACGLAAGA